MELHYDSLLGISRRIRDREVTSEAVTTALLDRIAQYDGVLNSTLLVMADAAMEQARAADAEIAAGKWRGPLHGVPIGVKDLLWTKDLPTTGGMAILRDFRPKEDATVVARLKQAGAVLIAKLHMTEGAGVQHHPVFARPVNPWSAAHWTGISSSGSGVATAAGLCFAAIGSDTGGSIRMPSSANNLTGIKPTWGRVSRHGLIHLCESLDHLGPMARTAGDAAAVLQAIAGADSHDPTCLADPVPDYFAQIDGGVAGLTLGIDWKFATEGIAREVVAAMEAAIAQLEGLGMKLREVEFPFRDDDGRSFMALFGAEVGLAHMEHFPGNEDRYGSWLRKLLEGAAEVKGLDVAACYVARDRYKGRIRQMFGEIDLLVVPGLGGVPPRWDAWEAIENGEAPPDMTLLRFTSPFNMSGTPTISLPAGFTADGLPIGIQLAGPWLSEPLLIRAGVAFQKVTHFHERHPDLDALAVD